jgi:hypothetical protein
VTAWTSEAVGMRTCGPRSTLVARSAFVGFRFPPDVIVLAVRWYLRFGLLPRRRGTPQRAGCRGGRHCCVAPTLSTLKRRPRYWIRSSRQAHRTRRPTAGPLAPLPPARSGRVEGLYQRMPGDNHPGTTVLLQAAHRSQSSLQPAVVALDPRCWCTGRCGAMPLAAAPPAPLGRPAPDRL